MLNYDKWKKLNESFMSATPIGGVTSPNGFLAYNPLSESEEVEDEEIEDEDEDEEDLDDEDDQDEEMQDETGEVEVVSDDGDHDDDHDHHDHHDEDEGADEDEMCSYCGSYMKTESHDCEMAAWLESVNSLINPKVNERVNGELLNEDRMIGGVKVGLKKGEVGKVGGGSVSQKIKNFLMPLLKEEEAGRGRDLTKRMQILTTVMNNLFTSAELQENRSKLLRIINAESSELAKQGEDKMHKGRMHHKKPCKKCEKVGKKCENCATKMKMIGKKSWAKSPKKMKKG